MAETTTEATGRRARLQRWIEAPWTQRVIIGVIIANAIALGLETAPSVMDAIGPGLLMLDKAFLAFFVAELALKIYAFRLGFFKSAWNWFDLIVVLITFAPAGSGLTVLRALRVLRAFRLVSAVPGMRRVVSALLTAIPSLGSIILLLCIVYYVASVIATKMFGANFPDWFGTIGASAYSLFQIMTLESWSMGIVRPVMEVHPFAWAVFVTFILVTSFTVLNLFIAVIVNAMQQQHEMEHEADLEAARDERAEMIRQLAALRQEVASLRRDLVGKER